MDNILIATLIGVISLIGIFILLIMELIDYFK
jgi:hypothetical protein